MSVTITSNPTNVKYIVRPKPEAHLWGCDKCSTTITLYVNAIEVMHRCKRTQKPARLMERK